MERIKAMNDSRYKVNDIIELLHTMNLKRDMFEYNIRTYGSQGFKKFVESCDYLKDNEINIKLNEVIRIIQDEIRALDKLIDSGK